MARIDQIRFVTQQRKDGTEYDVARVWIAGIPFSADLMPQVERIATRLAADHDIPLIDARAKTVGF